MSGKASPGGGKEVWGSAQVNLRCADVHPVRCDAKWVGPNANDLVARAVEHGAAAHGFTPAWYTPNRIAAIHRAAEIRFPFGLNAADLLGRSSSS